MRSKSMTSVIRGLLVVLMTLGLASCIKVDTGTRKPTMGSELIDLTRAREMGKVTDEEFQELRRKVLASF